MATSGSGQRKTRAWRKPREEIGPGTVELSGDHNPRRLNRAALHRDETQALDTVNEKGIPIGPPIKPAKRNMGDVDQSESFLQGSIAGPVTESITGKSAPQGVVDASSCRVSMEPAATDTRTADTPLVIDGSVLEGGGQILRNAMAMSCLLSRAVTITRIRAGRGNPGLRPQHLAGIELLSTLCGGELVGAGVGSTEITFTPRSITSGEFVADTKTAGSVCLILQAALPCLLFSSRSSKITLKGGTNADMAPPIDFTVKVFQPIATKFGVHFDCKLVKRGFYPKGRGEVIIATPTGPVKHLNAITMTDPGTPVTIKIHSYVAGAVSNKMSKQMVSAARKVFEKQLPGVTIDVVEVQETPASAFGNSSGIIAIAESSTGCLFAGSANGRRSDPPENTGKTAAEQLVRNIREGGCVDGHLQDQLIIFMALAKGTSTLRTGPLTLHTQTAIHIAELMTRARFKVQKVGGANEGVNLIQCEGIGLENKFN